MISFNGKLEISLPDSLRKALQATEVEDKIFLNFHLTYSCIGVCGLILESDLTNKDKYTDFSLIYMILSDLIDNLSSKEVFVICTSVPPLLNHIILSGS